MDSRLANNHIPPQPDEQLHGPAFAPDCEPFPRLDYDYDAALDPLTLAARNNNNHHATSLHARGFHAQDVRNSLVDAGCTSTSQKKGMPAWQIRDAEAEQQLYQKHLDAQYESANATEEEEEEEEEVNHNDHDEPWQAPPLSYQEHLDSHKYWLLQRVARREEPTSIPTPTPPRTAASMPKGRAKSKSTATIMSPTKSAAAGEKARRSGVEDNTAGAVPTLVKEIAALLETPRTKPTVTRFGRRITPTQKSALV